MAKTKDGNYFLDTNPRYFQEILDYLRFGEIYTEDPSVLKGVKSLANYFGLIELAKEIEFETKWIILDVQRRKSFKIFVKSITKFKKSTLAKYFLGDEVAIQSLSQWITKESENIYFIDRGAEIWTHLIEFMKQGEGEYYEVIGCTYKSGLSGISQLIVELNFFGFKDCYHHHRNSNGNYCNAIRWNKI